MKLSKCEYGKLVQDKHGKIGMIAGITNNIPSANAADRGDPANAIPLVRWSCGAEYGIHPGNIELLK